MNRCPVDRHHHHEVRAAGNGHVPDPAETPAYVVAQSLDHRSEQRRVLEAVAAPLPSDELLLNGLEGDAGMVAEEDVDVLERERPHMCLVQL